MSCCVPSARRTSGSIQESLAVSADATAGPVSRVPSLPVRGGLRLQILLLLGGLLLLAFVPLFFAVATYTSATLQQLRVGHARALGRAIAAHAAEARASRNHEQLMSLLRAEV